MKDIQTFVNQNLKLYSLPDIYINLKRVIDDPNSSLVDAVNVISHDPAMTMRILRIVNSAFFGFGQKIETVQHALNMMGMQELHDLVLASSVTTTAFNDISSDLMDMRAFWRKSIYCGVLSRLIANHCNVLDSDRLFVAGLLADIGHLVMYDKLSADMDFILRNRSSQHKSMAQLEKEVIGFDYSEVGYALMRKWKLPSGLQMVVRHHPFPASASSYELNVAIVHIAMVISTSENAITDELFNKIDSSTLRLSSLNIDDLKSIQQDAVDQLSGAEALLCHYDKAV